VGQRQASTKVDKRHKTGVGMRGGIWQDDKHLAFQNLGELLMKLEILKRKEWHYHFHFEPNPLLSQYRMFIIPF
jgi:hypothetical protein